MISPTIIALASVGAANGISKGEKPLLYEGHRMPIKGFDISSIDAKRFTKPGEKFQNLRIDNNSTVTTITLIGEDQAALEYRFTANYSGVGMIKMEGKILIEGDAKEIVDTWSKSNNMPPEVANQVHSTVITNCLPVAVVIARDIGLPPPLPPLPQIQVPTKKPMTGKDSRRNSPEIT